MPILLFLLVTDLNTEFYIFLLYAFLLFPPPTLETAQVLRTLFINSGAHQAAQVLHTLYIFSGVHQATQVLRKLIKLSQVPDKKGGKCLVEWDFIRNF